MTADIEAAPGSPHPRGPRRPRTADRPSAPPRVLLADRGDPLVAAMSATMRRRFDVVDQLDTELSPGERLVVAAATFRPARQAWAERFYKSNLGVALRSRRARTGLAGTGEAADVVFQTHALFETSDDRTVLYLDCTHRQSMEQWPGWNPLRGRALDRWLVREHRQYQQAAHLFAFYEETARSLVEQYGVAAERVSVVGAGLNFERLPALPERNGDAPPTILFVGNDFERKGGVELLAAFGELRRRNPAARLRIVGTPYPVPAQDGVEHLGRVHSRERMSQLYAEADVFCLPSFHDPFPGALLEAMAHALPCVVTATCGIPEMVVDGTTALTVGRGPTMVTELTDALEHLIRHPDEAARMGRLGRLRVEERFLWSHVVDRMAPAIERLAGLVPARQHTPPSPYAVHQLTVHQQPRSTTMTQTQNRQTQNLPTQNRPTRPDPFVSDRPWGAFQQLSLNQRSTVKIITVQPGSRLSLQRHEHRSEFWQVLDGPMDIEVDGRTWTAQHGEHIWVPAGSTHRMGNPGTERTRILEVAFGHFDEADIERLADDYSR